MRISGKSEEGGAGGKEIRWRGRTGPTAIINDAQAAGKTPAGLRCVR